MDFVEAIEGALSSCSVMLAVIGRRWAGDTGDQKRLHLPNDWIRLEIAAALKRGIRVIPVLVEGATPPADGDLPEDLKPLARRQAHTVSDERWDYDVQQLAAALESVGVRPIPIPIPVPTPTPLPAKPQSSKLMKTLAWIGGIFVGLVVIGLATQHTGLASGSPTSACGCWGYVTLGVSQQNPQCASGFHVATACAGYCAGGTAQWQSRCM